ncbi:hypothetical protein GCM10023323_16580 [Streptomyces thinghirensis]|uniref:Uncharacterized protein n=1 Tax=Streptomyces thinghirensis TaxID=551547 RepID=A0ABP9T1Y5_9ACTN
MAGAFHGQARRSRYPVTDFAVPSDTAHTRLTGGTTHRAGRFRPRFASRPLHRPYPPRATPSLRCGSGFDLLQTHADADRFPGRPRVGGPEGLREFLATRTVFFGEHHTLRQMSEPVLGVDGCADPNDNARALFSRPDEGLRT